MKDNNDQAGITGTVGPIEVAHLDDPLAASIRTLLDSVAPQDRANVFAEFINFIATRKQKET